MRLAMILVAALALVMAVAAPGSAEHGPPESEGGVPSAPPGSAPSGGFPAAPWRHEGASVLETRHSEAAEPAAAPSHTDTAETPPVPVVDLETPPLPAGRREGPRRQ